MLLAICCIFRLNTSGSADRKSASQSWDESIAIALDPRDQGLTPALPLNPRIPQEALESALHRVRLTQKGHGLSHYTQGASPSQRQCKAKGRQCLGLRLTQMGHMLGNFPEPLVKCSLLTHEPPPPLHHSTVGSYCIMGQLFCPTISFIKKCRVLSSFGGKELEGGSIIRLLSDQLQADA